MAAICPPCACDAKLVGRVDGSSPTRATTPISESTRNKVWLRDGGRCRVPGCRSTRHLDIHHLKHRRDGGDNSLDNLCLLCDGHHGAHHDGKLLNEGSIATGLVFKHADGRLYGAPSLIADATSALCAAGFPPPAARSAVKAALPHVGLDPTLESILQHALRTLGRGA